MAREVVVNEIAYLAQSGPGRLGVLKVTEQAIIDQDGQVVETRKYATWADLCQPPAPKEVQLRNGLWIKYLPWISTDKRAEIQRKATGAGGKTDFALMLTLMLEAVMIEPKVKTPKDKQMLLKADSVVTFGIMTDLVDTETFSKMKDELGEE